MNVTTSERRHLLTAAACTALVALAPRGVRAAMGPNDKFDLLVRNANVLDPSQNLNGKRDIGIRYGVIEAIDASIAPDRAQRVLDASGKLVTPGLIDLHAHTYPYGSAIGIPADELIAHQCTTTVVSAGDAGANNIAGFRRLAMPAARTRQFAFVHIAVAGLAGFPVPELLQHRLRAGRRHCPRHRRERRHRARRKGAHERERDRAPRAGAAGRDRRLREVRRAGQADGAHRRRAVTRLMSQILDLMRPGDVLTHCYSGAPNIAGEGTNIVQDGRLLPAALAAKRRGVVFDVGHGGGSFDYTIAEAAIQQGAPPDTISSDIHVFSGNTPGMPYLPWVMSKFLGLGFTLEQVITMATVNPARVIARVPRLGTLGPTVRRPTCRCSS